MRFRRAPRGARGLKRHHQAQGPEAMESRPARGAWIETLGKKKTATVWTSRPARGAWIETVSHRAQRSKTGVAPRAGRVD